MKFKLQTIYLGLGTNQGDRQANLQSAIAGLSPQVHILAQSPVYQTPPWGYTEQADFLNQVIKAETTLRPLALLRYLKNIEKRIGRTVTFRWGPREIDIDVLFYGNRVINRRKLTVPHPRLHQRAFMLVPLADLAPDLLHPVAGKTITQLLSEVDRSEIKLFKPI